MIAIYLLMALLGSAATIFALQNSGTVDISFLAWSVTGMPVALVILLSLLLGLVAASLTVVFGVAARRRRSGLAPARFPVRSAPRGPRAPPRLQPA